MNDNFGHEVGDQLLIEVAKRIEDCIRGIEDCIRGEDTVSRQGGDEFAVLLNNIESYSQCKKTLDRIHLSLSQPFLIENHAHTISATTGITLYPLDDGDIDTLVRHADQAMYQAKQSGRNRYHLFNTERDQDVILKHHYLQEIQKALENDEFRLYYQPKVNMATGDVFGVEALIRWLHPEKGLISPAEFLPLIDSTDLEIKIGNWVIEQALMQLSEWLELEIKLEVSINIASHHLLSKDFINQLANAVAKYPSIDAKYLQVEILESSALNDLNAISTIIKACQDTLNISVALDDFGTGYSSLTHLRSLPVNTIKIDRSFVKYMLDDPSDYVIIDSVIALASAFNRDVVAEGIETTEHGLMLLLMGCEQAQGFGIAKPMPAFVVQDWLQQYRPNKKWVAYNNKNQSQKQRKLAIFKLIIQQWLNHFTHNIESSPENSHHWPRLDAEKCPCGTWIKRAQQDQLFEKTWLTQLHKVHDAMHTVSYNLRRQYQDGEINLAREGLKEIQAIFDEMDEIMVESSPLL